MYIYRNEYNTKWSGVNTNAVFVKILYFVVPINTSLSLLDLISFYEKSGQCLRRKLGSSYHFFAKTILHNSYTQFIK